MEGIAPKVRGIFSFIIADAASYRLIDYLADIRGHDRKKRRYMGKVDY
jgi:fructoselysine-6-P-deglycase FrlB-like protein